MNPAPPSYQAVQPDCLAAGHETPYHGTVGYLVGQFPRSTHTFFWREICQLRGLGIGVVPISTRPPPGVAAAKGWLKEAYQETVYLSELVRTTRMRTLTRLPGVASAASCALRSTGGNRYRLRSLCLIAPAAALVQLGHERGFSHVHVGFTENAAQIALLASRLGRIGYSCAPGHSLVGSGPNQTAKWRRATFITPASEFLENEGRRLLGPDAMPPFVEVAPHGVDTEEFRRSAPYVPWDGAEPLRLFSCGRLTGCKGHLDAIQMLGELDRRQLHAKLRIAGDTTSRPYVTRLLDLADELGVRTRVQLLGAIDPLEVRREHERAHIYIHLSLEEGLGVAIIEAMAMSNPIVATRVGGIPELVKHDVRGLLVPSNSPTEAADAVERLSRDATLARRLGQSARRHCCGHFYASRSAEVLAELLLKTNALAGSRDA